MRSWSISQARARIAEVADAALTEGPQRIERRDRAPVVVVAASAWERLTSEFGSFADLILSVPVEPDDLAERRPSRVTSIAEE